MKKPTARSAASVTLAGRAKALHRKALVIDAEGVTVLQPGVHLPPPEHNGVPFLDRALAAGLTALNTTMGQGPIVSGVDDLRGLLNSVYGHLAYLELHERELLLVESANDIPRAKKERKLGVIFGVQGIAPKIEGDLTLLRVLAKLGLRIATLTQNDRNPLGCGCMEQNDSGMTQLGRACVREMNLVGILVDVAHAAERTALEAIEVSATPCIISHANVRALSEHPRNASDAVLKALAKKGGVIGITAYAPFIRDKREGRPTVDDVVAHVAYVADLVGVDHVGIGSDHFEAESEVRYAAFGTWFPDSQRGYRREDAYVRDFERVDDWPKLTEALLRRGFSDADTLKILGGNHLRVFRAAWGS